MKIGYLGAGAWGDCLAKLLAEKGYEVKQWIGTMSLEKARQREAREPRNHRAEENRVFTSDLEEAIKRYVDNPP